MKYFLIIGIILSLKFYSNLTDKEFLYEDLFLITLFVTLCKKFFTKLAIHTKLTLIKI